ncbi:MAG: sensor domain-containing diguanylate cyclase [Lysobacter sp.]
MDRSWRLFWQTLLTLLGLTVAMFASAQPFELAKLQPATDPSPTRVVAGDYASGFVTKRNNLIQVVDHQANWWRITASEDIAASCSPQLVISQPHRKSVSMWRQGDLRPVPDTARGNIPAFSYSSRFLVFPLKGGMRKGEILYLRVLGNGVTTSSLMIEPLDEVHRQDMSHVALRSLILTALGVISILAFGFWAGLRERGYAFLCLTLLMQTINLAVEGGEVRMIPWFNDLLPNRNTNVVLNTAAVLASVRFLMFFLDLGVTQPRIAQVLNVCSWLLGVLLAISLFHTWSISASFGNVVLLVVIASTVYASAVAIARRQREAYFLTLAWTPLMAVLIVLVGGYQRWWPVYAWLEYAYPVGLVLGGLGLLLGLAAKLQQLRRDHDSAKHRATYDRLTSVMTRAAIEDGMRQAILDAHQNQRPLTVVFFDIDHFKRINDEHGHSAGDEALRTVAERTRNRLRSTDLCGRYGGDEILVGLPGARLEQGMVVAEHLRRTISANPPTVHGHLLSLSLSVGVAELRPGENFDQLLERADAALYASKAGGRDRVTVQRAANGEVAI